MIIARLVNQFHYRKISHQKRKGNSVFSSCIYIKHEFSSFNSHKFTTLRYHFSFFFFLLFALGLFLLCFNFYFGCCEINGIHIICNSQFFYFHNRFHASIVNHRFQWQMDLNHILFLWMFPKTQGSCSPIK